MKQKAKRETAKESWVEQYSIKSQEIRTTLLTPLLKFLTDLNIGAQMITNGRLVLGIIAFLWFFRNPLGAAILFLIVLVLDMLDGSLARFQRLASDRGNFLDILVDQVIYVLIILALFSFGYPPLAIAYNIFIIGIAYILATIKKQESRPSDWIIKPRPELTYLKIITVIPFFLFTFLNVDIIYPAIVLSNIIATILSVYYFVVIQERWNKGTRKK